MMRPNSFDIVRDKRVIRLNARNSIYYGDIDNSFDYYFNSVVPTQEGEFSVTDFSAPAFHHVIGYSGPAIYFPSIPEPIQTANQYLEFADLKPGMTVLDLGAYSGLTSMLFKGSVGNDGRVIAVEPDPENTLAAEINLALYQDSTGKTIELIGNAIWSENRWMYFSSEGCMGSTIAQYVGPARGNLIEVEAITLSTLANRLNLDRVDFIKCDIEGAEEQIFKDTVFFERFRPKMIIEPHPIRGVLNVDKVVKELENCRYSHRLIEQYGVSLPLIEAIPIA